MMNIRKLYFFVGLLFVIHSCSSKIESEELSNFRSLSDLPISQWTFDEILAIDEQKYETFCKDEVFIDIATWYKKSKDYYYYSDEVDYKNISSTLDSILVKIDKYAKEQGCINLITYVDKYANTSLGLGARCYDGESVEKCWKRAWDYYDNTYKKSIYVKVKNENEIKQDIYAFFDIRNKSASLVYKDVVEKNRTWEDISRFGSLYAYCRSLGVSIFEYNEVHPINKALYDGFYLYYISGRWIEIGDFKGDANVCSTCQCNPCICYEGCPYCGHLKKECVCCQVCGVYPCKCNHFVTPPYPGGVKNEGVISSIWINQNIKGKINNYIQRNEGSLYGNFIYEFRLLGNEDLMKVWNREERGNIVYSVPVEAEDQGFVHAYGYPACPDGIDIYCFAKAIEARKEKRNGGKPESYRPYYTMFFITAHSVYALFSAGELGDFFKMGANENALSNLGALASRVETEGSFTCNGIKYVYDYGIDEDRLYQYAIALQSLGCDIQVLKLKNGENGDRDRFVKGWYNEYIENEESIR